MRRARERGGDRRRPTDRSAADAHAVMMTPLDPATLMMAIPAIMMATVRMAIVTIVTTIIAPVVPTIVAAVIAMVAVIAIIMTVTAIIILRGGAAARAERGNCETRRGENIANLHGILSLPGDRAMTGDTIALPYRS